MKRLVSIALLIFLAGSAYLLGWSNALVVKKISVEERDDSIRKEVLNLINSAPSVITLGSPIARVDKRKIVERLHELPWVDQVNVDRKIFSGEVSIKVTSRIAIARLESSASETLDTLSFLGTNLEIFTLPYDEANRTSQFASSDWRSLPTLQLGSKSEGIKRDAAFLLAELTTKGAKVSKIWASDVESIRSIVNYRGRDLDISWGNVKDIELKFQVLDRLLELNKKGKFEAVDLSAPLSPVVR